MLHCIFFFTFVHILKIHLCETYLETYCQETSDGFKTTWNYFESNYADKQSYLLSYFAENRDSRQFKLSYCLIYYLA